MGCVIYNSNWINLTIDGSIFENNTGTQSSAIYTGGSDIVKINNSKFINNIGDHWGAIYLNARTNSNSSIANSIFINNSAKIAGAISIASAPDTQIINCTFINNSASDYAGAIRVYSNRVLITDCKFINNSATNNGGAIYNYYSSNVNVTNSEFTENKAGLYGGAYFNYGDNTKIANCRFTNNVANYGGGIYNSASGLIVSGNTMSSNIANFFGNEIFNGATMGILNLKYLNNSSITVNNNTQITLYATLTDDMGNPITGQVVTFFINGLSVGSNTFIEGFADLTYFVNLNTENAVASGSYLGSTNSINLWNGMLRITSTSEAEGDISLDHDEYFVNDTVEGVINVVNNGPNDIYDVRVKINLPQGFNLNNNDIILSQGYYDYITNIWYIDNLAPTARAIMVFIGEFTQKGQYTTSINISGDNFNSSIDSFNVLVIEKVSNSGNGSNSTNGSNNSSNNGSSNGPNNDSNDSNSDNDKDSNNGKNGSNGDTDKNSNSKRNNSSKILENQNNSKNESYIKNSNDYLVAEVGMKKTGVPIMIDIFLVLLSIIGLCARKKQK